MKMSSLNEPKEQTPDNRRKDFVKVPMDSVERVLRQLTLSTMPGPIMTEMMDKLTISNPTGFAPSHQESAEAKVESLQDVSPVSSYLYPTSDASWLGNSEYGCEFCGHRAPHRKLKMLHTRRHSSNHDNVRIREMYSKRI